MARIKTNKQTLKLLSNLEDRLTNMGFFEAAIKVSEAKKMFENKLKNLEETTIEAPTPPDPNST